VFEEFLGRNQGGLLEHPLSRRGCELWIARVLAYYGEAGGVDIEIINGQLALSARSAPYLYSEFTPLKTRYVPGSRPMLEAAVAEALRPGMGEREQALALMRRCRDNRDRGLARGDLFCGGTEEELLKRGAIMCNEISRVFVCLCQVAGMPARLFSAHISGHMMAVVCADGRWAWIDPRLGLAPVNDRDEPASAWELLRDPRLFERQPRSFWADCRPTSALMGGELRDDRNLAYWMARFRDCYFNPREAVALGNYFVWEQGRYTYPWRIDAVDPERLREARHQEALNRKALGWPDYYFAAELFAEPLKTR
jgi:hypothetical protein